MDHGFWPESHWEKKLLLQTRRKSDGKEELSGKSKNSQHHKTRRMEKDQKAESSESEEWI